MIEMICSEVHGDWVGGGRELVERVQIMNDQVCYACENKQAGELTSSMSNRQCSGN